MKPNAQEESGMTLVESMMAILILFAGLLVMAQVLTFSVVMSKTYGRDAGKTTASARGKIDELVGLDFTGLQAGGSIYPSDPVDGYVDYLNTSGGATAAGSAAFTRQWEIVDESASLKKIAVSVTSNRSLGMGVAPSTVLVTQKTSD